MANREDAALNGDKDLIKSYRAEYLGKLKQIKEDYKKERDSYKVQNGGGIYRFQRLTRSLKNAHTNYLESIKITKAEAKARALKTPTAASL